MTVFVQRSEEGEIDMMRAIRDWLSSLDDAALRRSRFAKPAGPLPDNEREARRVCETPEQRLKRISKYER